MPLECCPQALHLFSFYPMQQGSTNSGDCSHTGLLPSSSAGHKSCLFFPCVFVAVSVAYGILIPLPGIEPMHPLHWKQGVLTTGLPGKSLAHFNCVLCSGYHKGDIKAWLGLVLPQTLEKNPILSSVFLLVEFRSF